MKYTLTKWLQLQSEIKLVYFHFLLGASSSDSDEEKTFSSRVSLYIFHYEICICRTFWTPRGWNYMHTSFFSRLHKSSPQPKPAVVLAEPNTFAEDTTPTITTTFAEPPAPSDTEAVPLTELIADPTSKQEDTELLSSKVVSSEIPILEPTISVVEPTISVVEPTVPVLEPPTPISEVEPTPPIPPLTIAPPSPPSPPSSQSISDVLLTSQQSISEVWKTHQICSLIFH